MGPMMTATGARVGTPATVTAGDAFVTSVVMRWKREDLQEKGVLILRALGCLFSLLSFIVMATNNHGGWMNFDQYDEYRYLVAISILTFLYCIIQVVLRLHRFSTGRDVVSARTATIVDFAGDQVAAYLLMSALSAGARHYKWALDELFLKRNFSRVIILEDDMENAPDFFNYFEATATVLDNDKSIMAVSSWNDNGQSQFVHDAEALYRSDSFPGLGWMLTKSTWAELSPKWPKAYPRLLSYHSTCL